MAEIQNENKPNKKSWLEKLKNYLKKNNINSSKNILDSEIKYEEIIEEKENQFEIHKKIKNYEFEKKINILNDLPNESISKINKKNNKPQEEYQNKLRLLQIEVANLKKENELIGEYKKEINLLQNANKLIKEKSKSRIEELKNIIKEKEKAINITNKENNYNLIDELKLKISESSIEISNLKNRLIEFEKIKRDLAIADNQLNLNKENIKRLISENNDLKKIKVKNKNLNQLQIDNSFKNKNEFVENKKSEDNQIIRSNENDKIELIDNYKLIFEEWLRERIKKFGPFNYINALKSLNPSKLSEPIAEKWYAFLNKNHEKIRLETNKIDEIEKNIIELSMIVLGTIPTKNSYKNLKREDRTMASLKSFIYRISNLKLTERINFYSKYCIEVPKKEFDYQFTYIMNELGNGFSIDRSYWLIFSNLREFITRLSSSLSYDKYMPLPREIPSIISQHFNTFGGYFQVARDSGLKIRAQENTVSLDKRQDINQLKNIFKNAQDFHNVNNDHSLSKPQLIEYIYTLEDKEFEDIKPALLVEEIEKHKIFFLVQKENKEKRLDELFLYDIKNDNEVNRKSEPINSKIKDEEKKEVSLFKLDFAKLEESKLEQKQTDERLNQIYSIQYDDENESEEEIENNNLLQTKPDNEDSKQADSSNLFFRSYYKSLIKYIEDNIDDDEAINKKLFLLFLNKNLINEEEFLEEINNFCYEEFNDLLLEEDDEIFYITKEVFENFKLTFYTDD